MVNFYFCWLYGYDVISENFLYLEILGVDLNVCGLIVFCNVFVFGSMEFVICL